jgi:hypothetical protein
MRKGALDDRARVILEAAYYGVILEAAYCGVILEAIYYGVIPRPKAEESHPSHIIHGAIVTDEIPRCARDDKGYSG